MKKMSFDFDDTLSRKSVQKFAKEFIDRGFEIHIVTSRYVDTSRYENTDWQITNNKDLFRVVDHLGIPRENIHFMNMESKDGFFKENPDFLFHLDDNSEEITKINKNTDVPGILCTRIDDYWKSLLQIYLK